jgi:hypothetical protein
MTPAKQAIATVESFLTEVGGLAKTAEAHTEPGSIGGATTHPVKSVEDHTQDATTGSRAAENAKDVKKEIPDSVDGTPEATAKKAEESNPPANYGIGTKVRATGEDPENETAGTKSGKKDPGSSHPARTDNDSLNGGKYAFDIEAADLATLTKAAHDLGNELCSQITVELQKAANDNTVTSAPAQNGAPAQPGRPAAAGNGGVSTKLASEKVHPGLAQQVGWELAGLLTNTLDKQGADAMVQDMLVGIMKEADADADRTAEYLNGYFTARKQAHASDGDGGQHGPPHEDTGAHGADPQGLADSLGGGVDPAAAAGGPPGAGGPPPGDPSQGGGQGGQIGEQELMQLLQQLGVTPEELEQAIMQEQAGGGAAAGGPSVGGPGAGPGGPPAAGAGAGMPPGAGSPTGAGGPPPPPGMEVTAADKQAQKQAMTNVITELIGRSRAKQAGAVK